MRLVNDLTHFHKRDKKGNKQGRGQEGETCPLCMEPMDPTDSAFCPCPCGYQVCSFCYEKLNKEYDGTCPGCRKRYSDPLQLKSSQIETNKQLKVDNTIQDNQISQRLSTLQVDMPVQTIEIQQQQEGDNGGGIRIQTIVGDDVHKLQIVPDFYDSAMEQKQNQQTIKATAKAIKEHKITTQQGVKYLMNVLEKRYQGLDLVPPPPGFENQMVVNENMGHEDMIVQPPNKKTSPISRPPQQNSWSWSNSRLPGLKTDLLLQSREISQSVSKDQTSGQIKQLKQSCGILSELLLLWKETEQSQQQVIVQQHQQQHVQHWGQQSANILASQPNPVYAVYGQDGQPYFVQQQLHRRPGEQLAGYDSRFFPRQMYR